MAEAKIRQTGDAAGLAALITRAAGQTGGEARGLPPFERTTRSRQDKSRQKANAEEEQNPEGE